MKIISMAVLCSLITVSQAFGDEPADFGGTWETTYGTLVLFQEGLEVSGYYTLGGYSTVQGSVDGEGKLAFTYQEPSASGEGWFLLSEDGNAIRGMWRPDGGGTWYDWEGYRAGSGTAPSNWLVVLESEWQTSLSEDEYSFGEMLAAWFARVPGVTVRHRFVHDADDLRTFCLESSGLPGDLYLVIASHGSSSGVELASGTVSSRDFLQAIEPCRNLAMIHFSCCEIMAGRLPRAIVGSRDSWPQGFLVSGYTNSVDWGASGIIEIFYLNQILENGMEPPEAAASVLEDIDFSGVSATGSMEAAGFTWLTPLM
ncbi:MAG: hypothetical protein JXA64_02635 [Candidatus Fermentibacteraceae bacterium]|nr:hypothetical protein [Candidatus Fermentibacteraceae bacterium]MBN2607985.1 hypothetical protein [Candidatus Fermentibacteraceae bacterium]